MNLTLDKTISWDVEERPIYNANGKQIKGFKELVNNEKGNCISITKSSYIPTKNEKLMELADSFTKDTCFKIGGYATYNNGSKVMAYLENEEPRNFGGLQTKDYLIIGNSHDTTTALFTGMCNQIYRCSNMFGSRHRQNTIRHSRNQESKIKGISRTTRGYFKHLENVYENAEKMSLVKVCGKDSDRLICNLLEIESITDKGLSTRSKNIIREIESSIQRESEELGGNLFGLFNGITHYTTHKLSNKNVFGSMLNTAYNYNQKAYHWCLNRMEN
ncbi:DUF932 domain-containing protein [Chondrinema litorale]|uniref:DUF932 domain-containing protein n=1 Tax=Chondrinema litorale TaxID=2994555 RepID=UPI00254349B4|nr:DUF932 domain-containing protein [Chondrinema litorale]UZS00034.1 DUF932 domain-containing protein [Chondrinema litorale]